MGGKQKQQQKQAVLDIKPGITSVDQLDDEIRGVAELELQIEDRENEMRQELLEIEGRLGKEIKQFKEKKAVAVDGVLTFAKAHKREVFGEKKSRKFNYGALSLSKESSRVEFTLDQDKVIANLERLGYAGGVVKTTKSIDKNAIEQAVPVDKREKVGFDVVLTGGDPKLTIDKRSIEILRDAQKQRKVS
jgi:phage host-nuclease inhibitor protein Gam